MRALRLLGLMLLAPAVLGAHCKEDCGPPSVRRVASRQLEHTLYGAGVVVSQPRTARLATALTGYEEAELRVDVSRPALLALVDVRGARSLARAGGSRLKVGDRGDGYRVIGAVDRVGKVAVFGDATMRAEVERAGYDAVMLIPREAGVSVWEASVAVDVRRRVERRNDDAGKCVDDRAGAALPDWALVPWSPTCGDGARQSDEECDGTNGCSPYCFREPPG